MSMTVPIPKPGRLLAGIALAGILRRTLYGLHAILRLHCAQEEEQYLPLLEEGAARRAGRSQPAV